MKSAADVLRSGLRVSFSILFGALLWAGLLSIAGAVLVLAGVHMLFGTAWAMIGGGVACLAFAVVMILGVRNA